MQYTITINQLAVIRLGLKLDVVDMAVFDYIKNFVNSSKCERLHLNGETFFWISHNKIIEDMPILGINTSAGVIKRINKLIDAELIERYPDCDKIRRTYYKFGRNYDRMLFISLTESLQPTTNVEGTLNDCQGITHNDCLGNQYTNNNQCTKDNILLPPISPKKFDFRESLLSLGAEECYIDDWLIVRKNKRASNTESALKRFIAECNKADITVAAAVQMCAENSWQGFKAEYLNNNNNGIYQSRQRQDSRRETPAPSRESISEDDWKF